MSGRFYSSIGKSAKEVASKVAKELSNIILFYLERTLLSTNVNSSQPSSGYSSNVTVKVESLDFTSSCLQHLHSF
jgi:hypothetical protein